MKKLATILFFVFAGKFSFAQSTAKTSEFFSTPKFVSFYPNPAVSNINFDFVKDNRAVSAIQIFNLIGKPVLEVKTPSSRNNISISSLYRGVYVFKLVDRNGSILETGKFQVVK